MLVVTVAVAIVALACQPPPPLGTVSSQTPAAPQWALVGDPAVLADGGHYYVFSSNTLSHRLPIHVVDSLSQVYSISQWDAIVFEGMPQKPAWAAANSPLWAPTVHKFGNQYVLFFAANIANPFNPANPQCIGRATSASPGGPYVAEATPFNCGLDYKRGALDPDIFIDPRTGNAYLYAAFADTEAPIHVIGLNAAGDGSRGGPGGQADPWGYAVYGKSYAWEGRFIENPSMTYDPATQTYLLAYSAGDWWTASYSTGLVRCSTVFGLCASNAGGPWLKSGNGRTGVGGLSFFDAADGSTKAAYASFAAGVEGPSARRWGTAASVTKGSAPSLGAP
jgi:hypothetical protein